jgi:hypothetical protein
MNYRSKISKKVHQTILNSTRHQQEGQNQGLSPNRAHYNQLGPNSPMTYETPVKKGGSSVKKNDRSVPPLLSPAFQPPSAQSGSTFQLPPIAGQESAAESRRFLN